MIPTLIKLRNILGTTINPATEDKQDTLISTVSVVDYISRIDQVSATLIYIGNAEKTALTSQAVWRISRIDTSTGIVIEYANGNGNYDNIWNNRLSLTYS